MIIGNLYFFFHELLICGFYKAFQLGSLSCCFWSFILLSFIFIPFQDNFGLKEESDYLNKKAVSNADFSLVSPGMDRKHWPWGSRASGFPPTTIIH